MKFYAPIHVETMTVGGHTFDQISPGIRVNGKIERLDRWCPHQRGTIDLDAGVFEMEIPELCGHCEGLGSKLKRPPTNRELGDGSLKRGSAEFALRTTTYETCAVCKGRPDKHFDVPPRGWIRG